MYRFKGSSHIVDNHGKLLGLIFGVSTTPFMIVLGGLTLTFRELHREAVVGILVGIWVEFDRNGGETGSRSEMAGVMVYNDTA